MQPRDIPAIAHRAAELLAEAATAPATVIMFGSHARGTANSHSDLDFLVIEDVENTYEETVRLRRSLRGIEVPVDILVVSDAEAATPSSLTVIDALREGVVLVERRRG